MAASEQAGAQEQRDSDAPRSDERPEQERGATTTGVAAVPAAADAVTRTAPPSASSIGARQVRAKTIVGPASDPSEREADQVAGRVLRMAAPEQNRPTAIDPSVADATSAGPGAPTSVTPERPPPGSGPPVRRATPAAGATPGAVASPPTASASPAGTAPPPATAAGPPAGGAQAGSAATAPAARTATPAPTGAAPGPAPAGATTTALRRQSAGTHDADGGTAVPPQTERYLEESRGTGSPLADEARRYFEARFSTDFGSVRVHDDERADKAARSIGAIAFTKGNDIWFSAGSYDPVTDQGRPLLAHELAHVAQQNIGIGRLAGEPGMTGGRPARAEPAADGPVRRAAGKAAKGTETKFAKEDDPKGTIDTESSTLKFETLPVPSFKSQGKFALPPLTWTTTSRTNDQRSIWLSDPKLRANAEAGVKKRVAALKLGKPPYYLQGHATKSKSNFPYVGDAKDIGEAIVIPFWDKDRNFKQFQVDHMKELQLGGPNTIGNMWLLEQHANLSSGATIMNNIEAQVKEFLKAARPILAKPPSYERVRTGYTVTFDKLVPGKGAPPKQSDSFDYGDIGGDEHTAGLEPHTGPEADIIGSPKQLVIYERPGGGRVRRLPLTGKTANPGNWGKKGLYNIKSVSWDVDGASPEKGEVGTISGTVFEDGKWVRGAKLEVPILGMPSVKWGGYVDPKAIAAMRRSVLDSPVASPIEFPNLELDLEKGLVGRGVIPTPSIKLLERVQIAVLLGDRGPELEASIAAEQLNLPGPFKVSGGGLSLRAGASGLSIEGKVEFEIERLAHGWIGATGAAGEGVELAGALDFDTQMFTTAHLALSYRNGHLGVEGELAVGEGKIAGIKSASAKVTLDDERVAATGSFAPSIKGLEHGELGFRYDPATGSEITGKIDIGAGIPGVQGGILQGRIAQRSTGGYSLAGDVTIKPSIPGVASEIHGHYEDGAFLAEADLAYRRGMLDGSLHLGVTNQVPAADGKPAGPPTDHLTIFGSGEMTARLAPWLYGKVGLQLHPDGRMAVTGEVGLPDNLEVFPEHKISKNIFSIDVDIPIVGVSIFGQHIGIFATIGGGLDASAAIGPGQLRGALKVDYDPERESDTRVEGHASFRVPASAGLRLFVHGGIGAGIPVVSADAKLEVSGELGLDGAAEAGADIAWTPARGIVLDAHGQIYVEPSFRFSVKGFVEVTADTLVHTFHLYYHEWKLADFEYGSNLRFGVDFPIHYEEGRPFNISLADVNFTYPNVNATDVLTGLIDKIV